MTQEEILSFKQRILKDLYRYRNGLLADSLKKQGLPYKNIFGLLFPQLAEIARNYPQDSDLAFSLWNEEENREFRLLALYLMPHSVDKNIINQMSRLLKTKEEAELFPFRLLRHLPYAEELYEELASMKDEDLDMVTKHFIIMLGRNLGKEN